MASRLTRFLTLSFLFVLLAPAAVAAPEMHFDGNRIAISGVTPKGSVYAYGLSREAMGTYSNVVPREILLHDADGDGIVVWTLERDIPLRSIWLAVDMASGAPAVATTPGYTATRIALSERNVKQDLTRLAFDADLIELVVVRPGGGAWRALAGRNGPADLNTDPDQTTVALESLEPKAGTSAAAPRSLRRGDVVLILDPSRAAYGLITIGE